MKHQKKKESIDLYNVYVLPNNQPVIKLGQYYAKDIDAAMVMASIEHKFDIDENWAAELAEIEK